MILPQKLFSKGIVNMKTNTVEYSGIRPSVGRCTVYASDYCALDSSVHTGGGTDDTEILQNILDKAVEWGRLRLIMDGAALVRGLRVYSDTTIECLDADCGFYLADGSDDALITNAHLHDDENNISDRNISLIGGTYNHNCRGQKMDFDDRDAFPPCPPYRRCSKKIVALRFFGVENFRIENIVIQDQKRYAMLMGNFRNVFIDGVSIPLEHLIPDTNQDGLHFHGPGKNLSIKNVRGRGGDDLIALNSDEGDGKGSIDNVLIDGVYAENATQVLRMLDYNDGALENVTIRNIHGTFMSFGFYIVPWFEGKGGRLKNILIEDIRLRQTDHFYKYTNPFLFRLGGRIDDITIKDISIDSDDKDFLFLEVQKAKSDIDPEKDVTHIGQITLENVLLKGTASRPGQILVGSHVDRLVMSEVRAVNHESDDLIAMKGNGKIEEIKIQ